ncbi:hypothetical protein Tco_0595412 [Tanacetum coccineum]
MELYGKGVGIFTKVCSETPQQKTNLSKTNHTLVEAASDNVDILKCADFWTPLDVEGYESYDFFSPRLKCVIDADVFREILDICPRIEGEVFTEQPWRTLAACFNICLWKTIGNDKLRKSRIDIL